MNPEPKLASQQASQPMDESDQWAIVLAAGEGVRLAPVTRLLYGCEVPKQFAFLDGDQSLLQQTMDRVARLVPPERTVVVVAENRRKMAEAQLGRYQGVQIICQPANAGTGPGILLPLSVIKAQSPKATLMITPSDHYIPELAQFLAAARLAAATVRYSPSGLVVLGAEANRADTDLGWILPEDPSVTSQIEVGLVDLFVEKPPLAMARDLLRRGGLWNTMVVFGTVQSLWRQSGRYLPEQLARFDRYVDALGQSQGRPAESTHRLLAQLYRSMPKADFSRSILQQVRGTAVVTMKQSGWCDCGTPERLLGCLGESVGQGRMDVLKAALHSLIPAAS
jgi:mannose-1-phosphate guanylyltransferase